ncbi:NACHT domain-containing protein [Phormidesmis priestleyi ULC007]|uniref:NACHT domain-containing protein n=1 Tax=Phormidesmis priestleyi ULC007 TaxID=1920490 RepID=A0A2T1DKG2_9CYAN|nr:NACHT domain-containing NTPase [Phormidesmis priestleyi]PSB20945.1 NACHT domain-containing protein [Phormidesmis priestleyi ULC007]PZO51900.1 MAG: NACHT domain-containing protein [Phormidesmis priestleyi]
MAKRSCHASQEGLKQIRRKYNNAGWTQENLADDTGVSRSTIGKFLAGKPIDRSNFIELCTTLDLTWEDIIDRPAEPEVDSTDIDKIVQAIREQIKPIVHHNCGTMRVLDMEQPIELTGERGIYTNVNILERITGRNRFEIADLQNCGVEEFDRAGLSQVTEKRVPGLKAVEQHRKLMVLGKPGAGKSTFLKYLAMQCIEGNFQANRIPVFITLKDFAEIEGTPDLFIYISQLVELPTSDALREILQQGQMLVLLDGLDEVREEDTKRVLRQILEFSDQFHLNQFVMTCRIAAKEYTFERFTEVEVADFDPEQIAIFSQNWFRLSDPTKAECFIQKLEENEPIQELASSPLLLTLLCLVFGESADFPANRSELYKEGLDILLKKWDGKRNIEREQLYKNLSLKRKEDLLSQIALTTFEQKDYFFKQKTLEAYISDFIRNLPNVDSDPEILRMDSEAVLKSIEAQHGLFVERAKSIYSFSHLTFQEYFAAREIVANSAYENLVKHLTEKRWREVFLLTTSMMRNADDLLKLMKQNIDVILAADKKLQQFLKWLSGKVNLIDCRKQQLATRAFYFNLFYSLELDLPNTFPPAHFNFPQLEFSNNFLNFEEVLSKDKDLSTDYWLVAACESVMLCGWTHEFQYLDEATWCFNDLASCNITPDLQQEIIRLSVVLYNSICDTDSCWNFISTEIETWLETLRGVMIEHRNIGHDWKFSDQQKQLLQQYYECNKLLIDCLNSDCYVSRDVRQEIEDTLLLPMSEIDRDRTQQT